MFIGYPFSGHSLIGSLLDAHPEAIIAHELDTLGLIQAGFSKRQIFYLLLHNSRNFASAGRTWMDYSYAVPNQWQGRFTRLRIIGDKKGSASTKRLHYNPDLLQLLRDTIDVRIKFIHVLRNPYDNISTVSLRRRWDLRQSIEYYFSLCKTVAEIKKKIEPRDLLDVRHESVIEDPKSFLRQLCSFLGLEASKDYLQDCAGIVFKSPHKSRHDVEWNPELINFVKDKIEKVSFLSGYSYET